MAWGLVALGSLRVGSTLLSGDQASKDIQNMTKLNVKYIGREAEENIRKTKLTQEQTLGSSIAAAGASGVSMQSETVSTYLDAMRDNFKKNIDWMEESKLINMRLEYQKGRNARRTLQKSIFGGTAQGIGEIASGVSK